MGAAADFQRDRRALRVGDPVDADEGGELLIADIGRSGKKTLLSIPGVGLLPAAGVNMQPAGLACATGSVNEIVRCDVPIFERAIGAAERRRFSLNLKDARAVGIVFA